MYGVSLYNYNDWSTSDMAHGATDWFPFLNTIILTTSCKIFTEINKSKAINCTTPSNKHIISSCLISCTSICGVVVYGKALINMAKYSSTVPVAEKIKWHICKAHLSQLMKIIDYLISNLKSIQFYHLLVLWLELTLCCGLNVFYSPDLSLWSQNTDQTDHHLTLTQNCQHNSICPLQKKIIWEELCLTITQWSEVYSNSPMSDRTILHSDTQLCGIYTYWSQTPAFINLYTE